MNEIIKNLKRILFETTKRNPYQSLLFSGGLDTSILAVINPNVTAMTVSLGLEGEDIYYSNSVARLLNIKHFHRRVEVVEAIEAIPEVIKILKSFDPAIPNDLVVYFGLELAKNLSIDEVATGDGSDELFGGYSFMEDMDDLGDYIKRISQTMQFSTNELAKSFNIDIKQPYVDRKIIELALDISARLKIREENGRTWGKWILRKAFQDLLPEEIVWQSKRPLEYGSGMTKLRDIISTRVTDEEFERNSYPVKFINKEHLYYYKVYMKEIGQIPRPKKDEKPCPGCGAGMDITAFHCRVCGYILDWRS